MLSWHLQNVLCPPPPVDPGARRFGSLARAPCGRPRSLADLCSNSGGSWFNTAFSYRPEDKVSTKDFLGEYVLPKDLKLDAPESGLPKSGSFGYAVGDSTLKTNYVIDLTSDKSPFSWHHHTIHAWSRALGHEFFRPFGEDNADDHLRYSYAIAAEAEAGAGGDLQDERLQEKRALKAPGVRRVLTACREDGLPYPAMVGAVAVPTEARQFRPFEFTPQYAGVPAEMQTVKDTETKLGGTFVEPIGVNSSLPNTAKAKLPAPNGPPELLELDRKWNVPVVQAAGISSAFIACAMPTELLHSFCEYPELVTFASGVSGSPSTGEMGFADGGGVDNLGVHAALRRNVKKLLVCVASAGDPSLQAIGGTLGEAYDVSGLFGACTKDVQMGRDPDRKLGDGFKHCIDKEVWNDSLQCFEKEQFKNMITELKDKQRFDTQPISCRLKLEVKPNPTQGITGGYVADVLFLFNSMPSDWKGKLPPATQDFIDTKLTDILSSAGPLEPRWTFPYVSTYELEWSPKMVGLSSNLCAYNMNKVREDASYRDFFQFRPKRKATESADGEPAARR